jgi:hypothetical protein
MSCARILFGWSCFLVSVSAEGCVRQPRVAQQGEAALVDSMRQVAVDWYRAGSVSTEGETCSFVPADHSPPRAFQCGSLLIGLRKGISRAELNAVLEKLSATLVRDRTARPDPWVSVAVRPGTELVAIERAYADPRVLHAGLNWSGVVVRGTSLTTLPGLHVEARVDQFGVGLLRRFIRARAKVVNRAVDTLRFAVGGCPLTMHAYLSDGEDRLPVWSSSHVRHPCVDVRRVFRLALGDSIVLEDAFSLDAVARTGLASGTYEFGVSLTFLEPAGTSREYAAGSLTISS